MVGGMRSRYGRKLTLTDYAVMNKQGFHSTKVNRIRAKAKKHKGIFSLPGSPLVSTLKQFQADDMLEEAKQRLKKMASKSGKGHDPAKCGTKNRSRPKPKITEHSIIDTDSSPNNNHDNIPVSPVDMSELNLKGLSKDEKLKLLKQKISELEDEEAKLQQEEDDEEVMEQMKKYDELKRRLSNSNSPKCKKSSKKLKSKKVKPVSTAKSFEGELSDDAINDITGNTLPSISDIQDLLHISDRKTKKMKETKSRTETR